MTTNQFGTPMSQVGAPVPADQQWSSTPVRHSKVGAAGGQIVVRLLVGLVVVGFGAVVRSHLAAPAPSIEGVAPGSCIHVVAGQVASGVLSDIAPIECGKPDSHVVLATGSMSGVPLSATAIEARIHKVAPSITEGIYVYDRERWVLVES
jgi:hypothetical protein